MIYYLDDIIPITFNVGGIAANSVCNYRVYPLQLNTNTYATTPIFVGQIYVLEDEPIAEIDLCEVLKMVRPDSKYLLSKDAMHQSQNNYYTSWKVDLYNGDTFISSQDGINVLMAYRYPNKNINFDMPVVYDDSDLEYIVPQQGHLIPTIPYKATENMVFGVNYYPSNAYVRDEFGTEKAKIEGVGLSDLGEITLFEQQKYGENNQIFTLSDLFAGSYMTDGEEKRLIVNTKGSTNSPIYAVCGDSLRSSSAFNGLYNYLKQYYDDDVAYYKANQCRYNFEVILFTGRTTEELQKYLIEVGVYTDAFINTYPNTNVADFQITIDPTTIIDTWNYEKYFTDRLSSNFGMDETTKGTAKALATTGKAQYKSLGDYGSFESSVNDFITDDKDAYQLNIYIFLYQDFYGDLDTEMDPFFDACFQAFGYDEDEANDLFYDITIHSDGYGKVKYFTSEDAASNAWDVFCDVMASYGLPMDNYGSEGGTESVDIDVFSVDNYSTKEEINAEDKTYTIANVEECPERFYLMWLDRCGQIQMQPFAGQDDYTEDVETIAIRKYSGEERNIYWGVSSKWKLRSGWLDDDTYPSYESIYVSPYLVLYDSVEDKSFNVLLADGTYTEKKWENQHNAYNLEINLKLNKKQNIFN